MNVLEILIITAIALIIFIIIRRLPDTKTTEDHIRHGSNNRVSFNFGKIKEFVCNLTSKYKFKKRGTQKVDQQEELKQQLKRPEDRDFWIEDQENKSKIKTDIISHTYFEEAEEAFKQKDYRKAETLFIEVAKTDPHNPKVFNRLGIIYLDQKNYEDAIEAFSTAIKYDDSVGSRYYNLALAHLGQGNKIDAIQNLKKALKLDPDNSKYRRALEQIDKK